METYLRKYHEKISTTEEFPGKIKKAISKGLADTFVICDFDQYAHVHFVVVSFLSLFTILSSYPSTVI